MSGNLRGALWILAACLMFAAMGALAKLLGQRLNSFEVAFARAVFGLAMVLPLGFRMGYGLWRTSRIKTHISRSLIGSTAMLCSFYALTHLPLAEATAISFTKPLFMVVLAAIVLHETVRARRWSATAIGFIGVLVMFRPGVEAVQFAALLALVASLLAAYVSVLIKQLVMTESKATILAYLGVVSTLVTGIPAAMVWVTPTLTELGLMVLMGVVGTVAQIFVMQGFKIGETSALAPLDYFRLPFAALFGWLLFAEVPDRWALLGTAIIVASTLYIAHREAQLARRPQQGAAK